MKAVFETRFQKIGETSEHYGGIRSAVVGGVDDAKEFARKHLIPYFADKCDQEEFVIVTLDTKHRPIRIVRITRGTLDASLVHPREVFRAASRFGAQSSGCTNIAGSTPPPNLPPAGIGSGLLSLFWRL